MWLAAEGRPKPPLVLDRQVKRAVNLFFVIVLSVCVLGRGCSPLPVTLSLVPSREGPRVAEALRGRVPSPASTQLDIQYNQGVSAVIFSDHRLAHHELYSCIVPAAGNPGLPIYRGHGYTYGIRMQLYRLCTYYSRVPRYSTGTAVAADKLLLRQEHSALYR